MVGSAIAAVYPAKAVGELFGPGLGFLKADDVGPARLHPGDKAFFIHRAYPVDVPAYYPHKDSIAQKRFRGKGGFPCGLTEEF